MTSKTGNDTQVKTVETTTQAPSAPTLTTNDNGLMDLTSLTAQLAFAKRMLDSRVLNSSFKTPQQVVIGMQYALAIGIDPRIALNEMYVVNGKPQLYGKGPLAIVEASGKLESIEEFWIDKEQKKICFENKNLGTDAFAAICRVKRKGDDAIQEDFFSIKDMAKAGLSGIVWNKYQRVMMRYRARAMALQSKFPDVLNGIDIAEYHQDSLPEQDFEVVESPKLTQLNKLLEE